MAATKDVVTRLKFLDELLGNRYRHYSIDDLTEIVSARLAELDPGSGGVSRRTVEKDLRYIEYEGPFLAEIERYTMAEYSRESGRNYSKHCLRYADEGFSIFRHQMNPDEEYLLGEALALLGQFDGLPNLAALARLRQGLRHDDRRIVSLTRSPAEGTPTFGILFTAISQRHAVRVEYRTFRDSQARAFVVHPWLLKEYNRRWYLVGGDSEGRVLTLALDRMDGAAPQEGVRYEPYGGDIHRYFDDIVGVSRYSAAPAEEIAFWVGERSLGYVRTKPLHASQREAGDGEAEALRRRHPHLEGGAFFSIRCRRNYELVRELCSFGSELLVLSPAAMAEEIHALVAAMAAEYEKLRTQTS